MHHQLTALKMNLATTNSRKNYNSSLYNWNSGVETDVVNLPFVRKP